MRELKFRIWDKQQNRFHTDRDWGLSLDGTHIIGFSSHDRWDHDKGYKIKLTDNLVIQQYTGLKDENGKDIYEGDILRYQSTNPRFSQVEVRWTTEEEDNHPGWVISDNYCQYGKPEVIGNVFENPELIK